MLGIGGHSGHMIPEREREREREPGTGAREITEEFSLAFSLLVPVPLLTCFHQKLNIQQTGMRQRDNRETQRQNRHRDRRQTTHRQTDTETDNRQTDRTIERQTDRQTER